MEHLIFWLVESLLKAITQRSKTNSAKKITGTEPRPQRTSPAAQRPTDVWAEYRQRQAAMEQELARKSPTARNTRKN